jgi:ribonuclease P protein component
MQSRHRISGTKRHSQIHREGTSAANRLLVIRYLANGLDHSRFAFVVSKRVGNAVFRNRVKRRLREVVRSRPVAPGWDAVLIARRGVQTATYSELSRAAWGLLRRSKLAGPETGQTDAAVGRKNVYEPGSISGPNPG